MLILLVLPAFAGPLNLSGGVAATGEYEVSPSFEASAHELGSSIGVVTGLGERSDIEAGIGMVSGYDGTNAVDAFELIARVFPAEDVGLALATSWTPGDTFATVGPEIHVSHAWQRFAYTANLGWHANLGGIGSELTAGVAPEVWIHPRVSAFVEVDPGWTLGEGFAIVAVPGLSASLDADGVHSLTVGVQIPVYPDVSGVSVGVAYAAVIGG
jgi:hypothetical protein